MLRKIRISLALICFTAVTLLFLDFTGVGHKIFGFLAKIQLVPALLATNALIIIALILLTLLWGRIYCSVICPLGVMQDIIAWFSKLRKKKRRLPYKYSKPLTWLRIAVITVFAVLVVAHFANWYGLIEPYAVFGKIASNILAPIYRLINNGLAYISERADSYAFYSTEVLIKNGVVFGVSVVSFLTISYLAWTKGRIYCNAFCPIGTFLGFISKYSIFKPVINLDKCNSCGICGRKCKSQCINTKEHKIDYSRCVACFDCIEACDKKAVKYVFAPPKQQITNGKIDIDKSKRNFLAVSGVFVATAALKAQESAVDGGLAVIENKQIPKRNIKLVPPGAENLRHFQGHCTACQLCISACPNRVLRPSPKLETLMQPEMQYDKGFCRPECTECSSVCPTGAIKRITKEQKSSIQIGRAIWVRKNCIVISDEITCSSCETHCPSGAITRIPLDESSKNSLKIPAIDIERCIGCGACENLCPARPFAAIYVEGNEMQRII
jgi:ferredoxin